MKFERATQIILDVLTSVEKSKMYEYVPILMHSFMRICGNIDTMPKTDSHIRLRGYFQKVQLVFSFRKIVL
jgi:hypothetical protein